MFHFRHLPKVYHGYFLIEQQWIREFFNPQLLNCMAKCQTNCCAKDELFFKYCGTCITRTLIFPFPMKDLILVLKLEKTFSSLKPVHNTHNAGNDNRNRNGCSQEPNPNVITISHDEEHGQTCFAFLISHLQILDSLLEQVHLTPD